MKHKPVKYMKHAKLPVKGQISALTGSFKILSYQPALLRILMRLDFLPVLAVQVCSLIIQSP